MKRLFILTLFSIGATLLHAQSKSSVGFRLGVLVSGGYKSTDKTFSEEGKAGFTGGITYNYKIGRVFSLQPELAFTKRGFGYTVNTDAETTKQHVDISYIELPIAARLTLGKKKVKWFLYAGPQLATGLKAKLYSKSEYKQGSTTEINGLPVDFGQGLDRVEFDVIYGTGLYFGNFYIDLRWCNAMNNVHKDDDILNDQNKTIGKSVTVRGASFSVGYTFPLGK